MSRAERWMQRILIFVIAMATAWFIVTQLFDRLEQRVPVFLALVLTYLLTAYLVLPSVIHASLTLLRRNLIPRLTRAADGLAADPVNLVLVGTLDELHAAFVAAGGERPIG
jgi:signal transduction histidine kinase